MDITLDKKSSTEASIKITLKESDYQTKVEEKVKDYAKKAQIKGFRPGKVPSAVIKKMYGKSILAEEVNHLLSHSLNDYIRENKLQVIGEPLPNVEQFSSIDWEHQKDFEFDYDLGLVDEFEYDLSEKQELTSYTITVGDEAIQETLENIKQRFGTMTNPETSEEGDAIYGKFRTEEQEENETTALLDSSEIEEKAKKQFVGLKKGDVIRFAPNETLKSTETTAKLLNIDRETAESLKGEVELTVENINRTEPAEMGQELFDKVFGPGSIDSEEAFLEKLKETLSGNYERETHFLLKADIKSHFVNNTKIDVPEKFLKEWLLRSNQGKVTAEDIDREYDGYVKELKWDLIKNKVSEEHEIKAEHEEILERAKSMIISQLGGPGVAAQLGDQLDAFADNYLKGENGQNYIRVYNEVRDDKVLDFIREEITITDKQVNLNEFKEIVENQNR